MLILKIEVHLNMSSVFFLFSCTMNRHMLVLCLVHLTLFSLSVIVANVPTRFLFSLICTWPFRKATFNTCKWILTWILYWSHLAYPYLVSRVGYLVSGVSIGCDIRSPTRRPSRFVLPHFLLVPLDPHKSCFWNSSRFLFCVDHLIGISSPSYEYRHVISYFLRFSEFIVNRKVNCLTKRTIR